MTLPANIRVNLGAPFPALVKASGPITLSKANGIWIVGFSFASLGVQTPPLANYPNDYLIAYDSVANTFFKMPLSGFPALVRPQRSITAAGNLPILATDFILNINAATDLVPIVPLAASRLGVPLTFKDLPGSHTQTLTATAPDELEGAGTLPLAAGQSVTLVPYNDGVNNALGYAIES